MVEEAAAFDSDVQTNALFTLIVIYNREQRYDDALRVIARLQGMYPRNRLLWLERGSTALRAGRGADARAAIEQGLAVLATDRGRARSVRRRGGATPTAQRWCSWAASTRPTGSCGCRWPSKAPHGCGDAPTKSWEGRGPARQACRGDRALPRRRARRDAPNTTRRRPTKRRSC